MSEHKPKIKNLVIFPTDAHEQRFRSCLTKTKTIARIYTDDGGNKVLAIRPKDFPTFRKVLADNGLANCDIAFEILKLIEWNPAEYIKFTHFK